MSKYVISDDCVLCGSCENVCPVGAIHEGTPHYQINEDECVCCGTCASQCPVSAIKEEAV